MPINEHTNTVDVGELKKALQTVYDALVFDKEADALRAIEVLKGALPDECSGIYAGGRTQEQELYAAARTVIDDMVVSGLPTNSGYSVGGGTNAAYAPYNIGVTITRIGGKSA